VTERQFSRTIAAHWDAKFSASDSATERKEMKLNEIEKE